MYARVTVNVPACNGEFDYAVPPELETRLQAGCLVAVPFGRQTVQGVVLELTAQPAVAAPRPILALLDPLPVLTAAQLDLARWLAKSTLQPLAAMVDLMLPPGLSQHADTLYQVREAALTPAILSEMKGTSARLLKLLREKGALRGRQIDRHFQNVDWRKTAQYLTRRGLLTAQPLLPPPSVRPKYVRTAQLAVPPEQAEAAMPTLGRTPATQQRRQAALRVLMREGGEVNVSWLYAEAGCTLADLQELAERELIVLRETEIWRDPLQNLVSGEAASREPPPLTPDQQQVWDVIRSALTAPWSERDTPPRPFLLQGVTGSGKTEIYLRAVQECLQRGQQAIILVPEIAITPQTIRRFLARFPGRVGLLHSRLSPGERYDTWRRARLGLLQVIVGPRSALFTPFPNPGLIVADECHDPSYYQSEPPFYHAVEAAIQYARLCHAICILGSATPAIQQRYEAETGESLYLELRQRVGNGRPLPSATPAGLPPVQIVDMRAELKDGNRHIFSRALQQALGEVLQRGEQAILYLNRRGTATYVFCRECGYVAKCPRCDIPLTYHLAADPAPEAGATRPTLRCHYCGYSRQMLTRCPGCGSTQIRQYGLGSEKVEAEVKALFPSARTLRWDWETTRQKEAHEIILSHFVAHRADVLIGTQMLAKGLDLPLVTLVGIVLAEVGLNLPDPFAAERTFNLLTQVAGRAGRSARGGMVILQTFQPEHYVIQCAARHDVAGFYRHELQARQRLGYPPFARLARLEYRHTDPVRAETEAQRLAEKLRREIEARQLTLDLLGPAPCFFARLSGQYRWQIILRGPDPLTLLRGKNLSPWRVEINPISLL
jgi:primosomal protein N' (replication factor Y)